MIIVFMGKTASGKTFYLDRVSEQLHINKVVTYTSRPPRKGETEGVDYHFLSKEEFLKQIENNSFLEYAKYEVINEKNVPDTWYYGTHINSFQNNEKTHICVLDYEGYKRVKKMYGNKVLGFLFHRSTSERIIAYLDRGGNCDELSRRERSDSEKFKEATNDDSLIHVVNKISETETVQNYIVEVINCFLER